MPNQYDPRQHHRRSIRLKDYDYSQSGAYFVTICVHERECVLGNVIEGETRLNEYGEIVAKCWHDLIDHYPHIGLDAFVVMPNHVHGVIVIDDENVADPMVGAGAGLRPAPTATTKRYPLSEIVRAFKSFSARRINELRKTAGIPFWQRNYYEHVIRNDRELNAIREYSLHNPLRWDADLDNPINTKRLGSIDTAAYRREAGL
jgi:putative transposase